MTLWITAELLDAVEAEGPLLTCEGCGATFIAADDDLAELEGVARRLHYAVSYDADGPDEIDSLDLCEACWQKAEDEARDAQDALWREEAASMQACPACPGEDCPACGGTGYLD